MSISVRCECGKTLILRDEAAGKTFGCPACGRRSTVPAGAGQPPPEPVSSEPLHRLSGAAGKMAAPLVSVATSPIAEPEGDPKAQTGAEAGRVVIVGIRLHFGDVFGVVLRVVLALTLISLAIAFVLFLLWAIAAILVISVYNQNLRSL